MNFKKLALFTGINLVVIILIIGLLSGKPKVIGVNDIEVISKHGDTLNVVLTLSLENPNFFTVSGKDVKIVCPGDSGQIGEGYVHAFSLSGGEKDTVQVHMTLSADKLLQMYGNSPDSITNKLVITGSFSPLFFISEMNVESVIEKKKINELLVQTFFAENDISFDSLNYVPKSPVTSQMDFNVNLVNTLNFPFTVSELQIEVYPMAGSQTLIGNWSLAREVKMEPGQPFTLPGSLEVHHMALMLAGLEKNGKDLSKAYISGYAMVIIDEDPVRIPFGFDVTSDMTKISPRAK